MKKIPFLLSVLFLSLPVWMQAQEKGFVLKGCLPGMRDGVKVALLNSENLSSETIVETTAKNGCFELRGKVAHPILCTLTTNNLDLLAQYAPPIRILSTPILSGGRTLPSFWIMPR